MQQTREWIEAEGFEVIYGDTDSTFVHLGAISVSNRRTRLASDWRR
jgi:DNA polymerase elongation subunit (family B)